MYVNYFRVFWAYLLSRYTGIESELRMINHLETLKDQMIWLNKECIIFKCVHLYPHTLGSHWSTRQKGSYVSTRLPFNVTQYYIQDKNFTLSTGRRMGNSSLDTISCLLSFIICHFSFIICHVSQGNIF